MRADGLPLFHKDFRKQWNESCKAAGLVSIGKDTAAKLLAIVYVLGGEREAFTHNETSTTFKKLIVSSADLYQMLK